MQLCITYTHTHTRTHTQRRGSEPVSCQDHVANQTCFDEVDLTRCFEDTAILYGISIIFWLLAGLEFCCYRPGKPRLKLGRLSITKTVSNCKASAIELSCYKAGLCIGKRLWGKLTV